MGTEEKDLEEEVVTEEIEETLESLRAERDDYVARWQRSQADCMNMRRRSNEDLEARLFLVVRRIGVVRLLQNCKRSCKCQQI